MSVAEDAEARQLLRSRILGELYEASSGFIAGINAEALPAAKEHGWEQVWIVLKFLRNQRLIEIFENHICQLTSQGVLEYEASLKRPKDSTAHFSAPTIMHFNAPVGAVQGGANATAHVQQAFAEGVVAVLSLQELRGALREEPHDRQVTAFEFVDAIEVLLHQKPLRRLPLRLLIEALVVQLTTDAARNVAAELQHLTTTPAAND